MSTDNNTKGKMLYWNKMLVKPEMEQPSITFKGDEDGFIPYKKGSLFEWVKHLNSLSGIPVSKELQDKWKDGEWKEEGKDYALEPVDFLNGIYTSTALPVTDNTKH